MIIERQGLKAPLKKKNKTQVFLGALSLSQRPANVIELFLIKHFGRWAAVDR